MPSTSDLDLFAELRSMPGLAEIPKEVTVDLVAAASQRREHAGALLVEQGKASAAVQMLARGAAKIVRVPSAASGPDDEIVVDVLRGPTILADASALDGRASPTSVVALRSSQIISVPSHAFDKLARAYPDLARAVALRHAAEARAHARHLEELVIGSVDERLRRLLDRLAAEHGTPLGQGRFIAIPLRRRDVASLVNATTETVSRLLAKLERDGAARTTRDGIWWRTAPAQGKNPPPAPASTPSLKDGSG